MVDKVKSILFVVCLAFIFFAFGALNPGGNSLNLVENCVSQEHAIYGLPKKLSGKEIVLLHNEGYLAGYDSSIMQSRWVSYELTSEELIKVVSREDKFRPDTRLKGKRAELNDYKKSGYDRGHLAPAADMAWSAKAMSESFLLTNMSPQLPSLNRGEWKRLEEYVRDLASDFDTVAIVTGPLFTDEKKIIGKGVRIPTAFYKVLLLKRMKSGFTAIGFILPNSGVVEDFTDYAVSVDSVEKVSGFDFFSCLPDKTEQKIESRCLKEEWFNTNDARKGIN